jgi:hypothetical protein
MHCTSIVLYMYARVVVGSTYVRTFAYCTEGIEQHQYLTVGQVLVTGSLHVLLKSPVQYSTVRACRPAAGPHRQKPSLTVQTDACDFRGARAWQDDARQAPVLVASCNNQGLAKQ